MTITALGQQRRLFEIFDEGDDERAVGRSEGSQCAGLVRFYLTFSSSLFFTSAFTVLPMSASGRGFSSAK